MGYDSLNDWFSARGVKNDGVSRDNTTTSKSDAPKSLDEWFQRADQRKRYREDPGAAVDAGYIDQYLRDYQDYWSGYGAGEDLTDYRLNDRRAAIDSWLSGALADGTIDQEWYDQVSGLLGQADRYVGLYQGQRDAGAYMNDWRDWYNQSADALDGMDWSTGRGGSAFIDEAMAGFADRDAATRAWLEANKGLLGERYYTDMLAELNSYGGYADNLRAAYDQNAEFFGQWDTQDAYDRHQQLSTLDIPAERWWVGSAEDAIAEMEDLEDQMSFGQANYRDEDWNRMAARYEGLQSIYGQDSAAARAALNTRATDLKEAETLQAGIAQAQKISGIEAKYSGMSYQDMKAAMSTVTDPVEKAWLEQNAPAAMTTADYDAEIADLDSKTGYLNEYIKVLRTRSEELADPEFVALQYGSDEDRKKYDTLMRELGAVQDQLISAENEYDKLMSRKWQLEQDRKYAFLNASEDYEENSVVDKELLETDHLYRYINSEQGDSSKEDAPVFVRDKKFIADAFWLNKYADDYSKYFNMDAEEVAKYNYIRKTQGEDAAKSYLEYLEPAMDRRNVETGVANISKFTGDSFGGAVAANALSVPLTLAGGTGYLDVAAQKAINDLTGNYKPINYNSEAMLPAHLSNAIRGTTAAMITDEFGVIDLDPEDHPYLAPILDGRGLADVYQLGMSAIDSKVAALTGNPVLATTMLASSAATQGMLDALERGATDEQALQMGLWNGAFEAIFEFWEVNALLKGKPSWVKAAVNQAITEGVGEGATSIANNIADAIIMADKSAIAQTEQEYIAQGLDPKKAREKALVDAGIGILWDAIGGAASGAMSVGGMAAGNAVMNQVQYAALPKTVKNSVERLRGFGMDKGAATELSIALYQGAEGYGDQAAAYMAAFDPKQDPYTYASDFRQAYEIGKNNGNQEYLGKLSLNEDQRKIAYELGAAASRKAAQEAKAPERSESDEELTYSVSDEGTTIDSTGKAGKVMGFTSVGDKAVLELEDGKTIDAKEVSFGTEDEAVLYETVAQVSGSAETANRIMKSYSSVAGKISASDFAAGLRQAYDLGVSGQVAERQLGTYELVGKLPAAVRSAAFNRGKTVGQYKATARQAALEARGRQVKGQRQGQLHFDRKGRTFDSKRESSLKAMEALSKALGVNIYVYESYVEGGKRVYQDRTGAKKSAPNGFYDKDGIHIDLNAGNFGQGTMMFTVAHELTHFIKEWSPVKFRKLADILVSRYAEQGVSVRELIDRQIAKARENGREIDRDTAFEEVVADSMETMLTQGDLGQMMAELKQKDKTLAEKIREWFKNLADSLKAVADEYRGAKPESLEGRLVAQMDDFVQVLQQAYAEALVEAGENYRANEGNKKTTREGGKKEQSFINANSTSIKLSGRASYSYNMATVIQEYLFAVDNDLLEYAENCKTNKQTEYKRIPIGTVTAKQAADAKQLLGIDFSGYINAIEKSTINHIEKRHGEKGKADSSMANLEDVARIGYILNHYDDVEVTLDSDGNEDFSKQFRDKNNNPAPLLKYSKKINGTFYVVLACPEAKHKKLWTVSAYISKNKDSLVTQESDEITPDSTPKAGLASPTAVNNSVPHEIPGVNNESTEKQSARTDVGMTAEQEAAVSEIGLDVDAKTESMAPAVLYSERTWTESEYVQERDKAALAISKAIGVTPEKAAQYIDDINSIAKMIAEDRTRLDYFSSPNRSSFVGNVEYGGSFDFSTLCKKRRLLTGTFTAIQKALPNTALTANEILEIRDRMKKAGLEVSCGLCYVEGSRANMGQFAKEFLRLYKQYHPDAWQPNMADVNTPEGIEWVRINHPECYEQYEYFWNHYGTLKPGDKNLFASQQKPKLYQLHTEYKGEILQKFNEDNVEDKNLNGGIRLQSFSDFEIVHLIDTMQIIMDMSRVGLNGQAYTKVPDFAWALGDTGLKINLSLIAKGVDENGKLIFDDVEGMPINEAMRLRERYSENVGTILVAFNDQQLMAAMADDRVDFIIPFHRSQWKKSQYEAMGLPAKTKDYTFMQNEKFIKPQYHEYRGRMVKDKASNYMPNEYWDFSKSGKENAEAYLELCARNNKRPKFYKLLTDNKDGSYSLKADGSTDGYWKLLIDFKMYDNQGNGSPQRPVRPDFNMAEANRMLEDYKGGHSSFPVAQGIVDKFVAEYKDSHKGQLFSDRDPTAAATAQELEKQGKALEADVENLVEMLRLQGDVTRKDSSILSAARYLSTYHGVIGSKQDSALNKELAGLLRDFYGYLDTEKDLSWEKIAEKAKPVTEWIFKHTEAGRQRSEYARNVLAEIRSKPIRLTEAERAQAAEGYDSYDAFRKSAMGSLTLANQGSSLEAALQEWERLYPGTFDAVMEAENKPQALMDTIRGLRTADTSAIEYAYIRDMTQMELVRSVYDSFWRMNSVESVRTKNDRAIENLRRKHRAQMTTLQQEQDRAVDTIRRERKASMEQIRNEYRSEIDRAVEATKEKYRKRYAQARERARKRGEESRAVASQRQIVEKAARDMMDMLRKPTKDAHVPMALQKPLEKLLNSIDFTSNRAAAGGEPTIRDVAYTRALHDVKLAIAAQRTALEGNGDGTFSLDVPKEFLDQIDAHIKMIQDATEGLDLTTNRVYEMTSDELKDLAFILKTINKAIRDIDRLHMAGAKARVSELAKSTVSEMGRRKAVKTEDGGAAMWANYTPTFAFERMGQAATQILNGLKMGQAKLARTAAAVIKFSNETYTNKEVKAWENEVHDVELDSGETVKMTTAQIMSFYCLSRREQAKGHLTGGGIRMGNIGEGRKTVRQTDHFRLTQNDIANINGLLTDRQIAVANKMQRYMADVGGRLGNEISMARWDYMEMTDRDYFPIRSDSDIHDARNPDQDKTNLWALLNKSFTKQVTKGANDAMIVSSIFDVFADHMSDMAEYNAFALPLVDAMKWYNYRESTKYESGHVKTVGVKKALTDKLGTAAAKYFIDLMTDINSSQKAGRYENFFGKLLSRSKAASVGWNLRVAIQQPTAILRASVYLDPMSLVKGTVKKGMKASIEEMKKYSGIALWKSLGYYDLNISRGIRDQIKGDTTVLDQINDAGMWLPGKVDEATWSRIWESCKAQVVKEQKLSGERLLEETAKLFEDVVYHTQVADSVLTRSSLMRSKSQTVKELTSFMAEPTLSVNLLLNAFQDYREGVSKSDKVKRTMKILFCGYVLSAVANAVFTAFADAFRDDDEYEGYWDKFFQALLGEKFYDGNLFAELNPLEKIVFVRDVLSLLQGYEGTKNPFVELAESGIKLVQNIAKFFQGKGSLTVYGLIYQSLQVLGGFTGAAPANLLREASTIWNWTFGKWNNMPLHRYKTDPKSQIRDAYKSGALKKSEAREALMAAGISVTDAYWIIKDWDAGESTGRYDDVYKAALAGDDISAAVAELVEHGEKTEKEVLSQLKSQIGTWYTDPESDTKIDRQEAEKMLRQYFDLDDKEIEEQLLLWDMKVDTGFSLDGLKQKFLDEAVSAEDAVRYLMEYGGKDQEDAQERVDDWAFELEHGYSYDDIRQTYLDEEITADEAKSVMMEVAGKTEEQADYSLKLWDHEKEAKWRYEDRASLYKDGKITKEQLVDALIDVGEYDRKDAEYQVEVYEWEKAGLDGATIKRVQKWHEYCEKAGVTKEQFLRIQKFSSDTKNNVDANGKTINYSAMKKVMAEINKLPLSASQKDALAKSLGWSDKNIRKYKPW